MSLCVMAMSEPSSARRKSTRRVTPRAGKNTMKRDTKPVVDLEKPRTSDDLNKDTLVNLFGPDYLEELEDLDEEDDFEEEEEEVQTSSPSPPPQPSQPKRVKIPISTDPLEKVRWIISLEHGCYIQLHLMSSHLTYFYRLALRKIPYLLAIYSSAEETYTSRATVEARQKTQSAQSTLYM